MDLHPQSTAAFLIDAYKGALIRMKADRSVAAIHAMTAVERSMCNPAAKPLLVIMKRRLQST
ncbi:hypothetical protein AiwAL_18055 [Acidiphilium sp. AL]|uniref:Uncharacterized protein n=1 Tax=Acidiphilium iwatense TaxID=768198 RepID=A0ABS9E0P3_9PROT|nr:MULTISPECIES: hypothetical protein [Acidiphilium]MCF3948585.1 hypothetical protein [Acidiphilium iwatense]MCU4161969.1 hypothetical protein [Acidiphilium sp. AL]